MAELKNLKKGDTVVLRMFTGMAVGKKEVVAADAKTVTLETNAGKAKFSKKDGLQVEPAAKEPRFSNYITEDDGSYEKEVAERKAKREAKKAEKPKKSKKAEEAPKPEKKSKKAPEPVEEPDKEPDDDDDEYEEVE